MSSILLIADDEWVRNEVAAAIDDVSTTIHHHSDPRTAAEVAGGSRFDFILVDMQVGSMGGVAITRALHDAMHAETVERTPVVLLLDRSDDVFQARRVGADAYLAKPFTAQDLRSTLVMLHPVHD